MEVKTPLLPLLVIVGLTSLTESIEIDGLGDDNNLTCDAMREIYKREMARHEEQIVKLKEQLVKLKERNDKLKERNARLEQNRNDEVQQDKQLQELRREEDEVLRPATSKIKQSIRQRDPSGLTAESCRENEDKMQSDLAKNEEDKKEIEEEKEDILNQMKKCGGLVEQLRTQLVDGPNEKSGRLEVKIDGEWGSVCSKGTEHFERGTRLARVVCKSLGFSGGKFHPYGEMFGNAAKDTPIFMDDILNCNGNEKSIHDCSKMNRDKKYARACNKVMVANGGKHTTRWGKGLDLGISCE